MTENEVSYIVRGAIFDVYKKLGPGLLESVYEAAMCYELEQHGCRFRTQVPIPVIYETRRLELGFRMDILVEEIVIIEIKSIEAINEVHHKQLLTYLKLADKKLGLLVNFNTGDIGKSIFRKVNGL